MPHGPFEGVRRGLRRVARPAGLEPATVGLEVRCSIQLSYGRPRPRIGSLGAESRAQHGGLERRSCVVADGVRRSPGPLVLASTAVPERPRGRVSRRAPAAGWEPPARAALQNPRQGRRGLRAGRAVQGRPGDRGEGRFGALAVGVGDWETEAAGCTSPEAKRRIGRDRLVFVEVDGERIESPISSGSKRNQASVLEANLRATCAEQVGIDPAFVMRRCVLHAMQAVRLQLGLRFDLRNRPAGGRRSRWMRADVFSKHGGRARSKRVISRASRASSGVRVATRAGAAEDSRGTRS